MPSNGFQSRLARRGADVAGQLRSAQAMKEPPVHGSAIERAQRAAVGVRQNGLTAKLGSNLRESAKQFRPALRPRKCARMPAWRGRLARDRTLRPHPPHGIKHPIGRVHPVQIFGHLGAQKSAGHRMRRIALNPRGTAIFHGDQNSASVRTIMRTGGMDNLLHGDMIINLEKKTGGRWPPAGRIRHCSTIAVPRPPALDAPRARDRR